MNDEFNINNYIKNKNYVIEASAGTGKTYTIIEIVKKLLSDNVTLDKILIVTYTEKAAGELKDRIRKALANMQPWIKDKPENDVDKASISTIHSFCQKIINEFFISAGKPSCQKLIDEKEIKDFLKRYIRQGNIYSDICEYKKSNTDDNIEEKLINNISAYIDKFYLNKAGKMDIVSFNETEKDFLDNNICRSREISEALNIMESSNDTKAMDYAKEIKSLNKNDLDFDGRKINKKNIKSQEASDAFDIINRYKNDISDKYKNKNDRYFCDKTTFKYLSEIYIAWQKEKDNLCEQTYNDMIRNVREEVINNGPLLNKIKEKYSYAVIDEFQDTNQKQWDIFKSVFLTDNHQIVVVGDPKQSIYAFQGADVTVYNKAKKEIGESGGILCSLKNNYRATKDMIDATNNYFQIKNTLPNDIDFTESKVGNNNYSVKYDGEDIPALWIVDKEVSPEKYAQIVCDRIVDFCSKPNGKTKLQVWDKDGNQRDVSLKDFAVLARSRSEMIPLINEFKKCGIPYAQYKDKKLFLGKECADWIAILEAISVSDFTGKNRSYFKKAMLSCFFGYSFDDIPSLYFDSDAIKEIEFFMKWRELVVNKEWTRLIEKIIVDTDVFEKLREHPDLITFGVLMQIGDYCSEYLSKNDNLDMLIRNLRKLSKSKSDEGEDENDETVAVSTDLDCVRIMTIHASKGLEFPVVISVAGFKGESSSIQAYSYHENDKNILSFLKNDMVTHEIEDEYRRLIYVEYTRAKYLLMLPYYENVKESSSVKFLFKKHLTEYRDCCADKYYKIPSDNIKSVDDLKKSVAELLKKTNIENVCGEDELNNRKGKLKEFANNIYFHTAQKHAYSSLSHGAAKKIATERIENDLLMHDEDEEAENPALSGYDQQANPIKCDYDEFKEPIILSPNFIAGTGLGNALHKIFEIIDYKNPDVKLDDLIIKSFADEKIRCKDEWVVDVKNMVNNVLNAKLPIIHGSDVVDDGFSLNELGLSDRQNEVEFNFNIPKNTNTLHYMNGFVDLIFKRGEYYSVLDWKSDRLNSDFESYNKLDDLKKHCDEHYSIQRVLYSYCLVKWLKQFYNESEEEIFNNHFGGIYYVFLRGCNTGTGNGIYAQTWKNFAELENAYKKIIGEKVH